MKIGIMVDSFRLPIREGIQKAAELGAQGLQMYAVKGEMAPEQLDKSGRKELRDYVESLGLEVAAVCGDLGGHGFTHAGANPDKIERSKRIIELAKDLGTSVVTTHLGVVPEDESSPEYIAVRDACEELGTFADSIEACLAVETGPEPSERLGRFIRSLPCSGIRVNFDPANLAMVIGEKADDGVRNIGDLIVHTHAKDGVMIAKTDPAKIYGSFAGDEEGINVNVYFKEVPLGEGDVEFVPYIAALQKAGFDGFLTIERETGDDPAADIAKAVGFLQVLLQGDE
ncbi:MAG: sugar phosphate isomerase/epimerase [Spirochaetales bacterium]|jgi:L-ribulose-5-phosphate 3-epimerase|nr:sugar phosphate isomerase/epimerase [Spirochaetales bacterium]